MMYLFYFLIRRIIIILSFAVLAVTLQAADTRAQSDGGFDIGATSISSATQKVQWHGYYEFEYWDAENANNTFDAHKVTMWMGLPINKMVFLSTEIEYEHFPRLPDDGGEIKVDSAQLRITPRENLAGYLGIFYVPFGIEYFSYPGHKNKLVTRPKVMKSGGIIPGTWSDVGVGFNYAHHGIGQIDFFILNGDAKNGGIARDSKAGGNDSKSIGGRVQLDGFIEGLNVGASYVTGKWDTGDNYDSYRVGAHMRLKTTKLFGVDWAPLVLAEYVTGRDDIASSVAGMDKKVSGFYAQVSSWIHPKLEVVTRHGQYDNDREKTDNYKYETSIGIILYLLDNFQIKAEHQWNQEEGINKTANNVSTVQVNANW